MEIEWNGSRVFYDKTGDGPETLLLFHGFGQDHTTFKILTERLSTAFTCYCFDLFYHGNSVWNSGNQPLSGEAWKTIIQTFLAREKIQTFSLLGFSIGARLVLSTFESFPEQTRNIFLIAPEGLKTNFWYALATGDYFRRAIFKTVIKHPTPLFSMMSLAKTIGIVHPTVIRFAKHQMASQANRSKVYNTWVLLRNLKFKPGRIASLVRKHHVELTFILGKEDHLIKEGVLKSFLKRMDAAPRIVKLDSGHLGLLKTIGRNPGEWIKVQNGIQP